MQIRWLKSSAGIGGDRFMKTRYAVLLFILAGFAIVAGQNAVASKGTESREEFRFPLANSHRPFRGPRRYASILSTPSWKTVARAAWSSSRLTN
jgi:hypothetical protein